MKLDPKAHDKIRSNWRLGKFISILLPETLHEPIYCTCGDGVLKGFRRISFSG